MIVNKNKCPVCGNSAETMDYGNNHIYVNCNTCGYLYVRNDDLYDEEPKDKNKLASYLYYNGKLKTYSKEDEHFFNMITDDNVYKVHKKALYHCGNVNNRMVESWFPDTFSEKVDMFLLGLSKRQKHMGDVIELSFEEALSACFVNRFNDKDEQLNQKELLEQANYLLDYLKNNRLVDSINTRFQILPEGQKRIDELQKHNINNKNVFVSMAFNDNTKETREAIRKGIIEAEFSPEFLDEIIHNKQIVPEMFRLIRECRFLILDISDPNYGAYYEAGYALGLGKEVIITCKADVFNGDYGNYSKEELNKFEKYLKPHFDIAQKQILVWDNYEDLTNKLAEWIKALF